MFSDIENHHLLIGAFVALAVAASVSVYFSIRNKAQRHVRGRSPLNSAEFAALFPTEAQAAWAPIIRELLRAYIPVDPALVRPDDRLCEELQLAALDGLDANAFVMEVGKAVGQEIPDHEAQRMFTLRDIVSYVATRNESAT